MKPASEAQDGDHSLAGATARLLSASASAAGALGLACAALAAAALLLRAPGAPAAVLLAVLAAAPVERLLALRLQFDAGLFADLARARGPQPVALVALDRALQVLRLRTASPTVRPLADRARGAQRLIVWHGTCALLQFAGLLVAAAQAARVAP